MNLRDLAARDPDSGLVRVIVGTPCGSRNKYKFDEELALFKLSRVLPAGMSFPCNFGSIPGTRADTQRPVAAATTAIAPRFMTPITSRIAIRPQSPGSMQDDAASTE